MGSLGENTKYAGNRGHKTQIPPRYRTESTQGVVQGSPAHALGASCGSVPTNVGIEKIRRIFFQRSAGSAVA
jgi:hypothetical protein